MSDPHPFDLIQDSFHGAPASHVVSVRISPEVAGLLRRVNEAHPPWLTRLDMKVSDIDGVESDVVSDPIGI